MSIHIYIFYAFRNTTALKLQRIPGLWEQSLNRCQDMQNLFPHTHAVSERYISTTHKPHGDISIYREDRQGKHGNRPNKTSETQSDFGRRNIESFQKRKAIIAGKTQKENLGPDFSLVKNIYTLCKDACPIKSRTHLCPFLYTDVWPRVQYNWFYHP